MKQTCFLGLLFFLLSAFICRGQSKPVGHLSDKDKADMVIREANSKTHIDTLRVFIRRNKIKEYLDQNKNILEEQLKDDTSKYVFYHSLAFGFYDDGSYSEAQPLFITALQFAEKIKSDRYQVAVYNSIANVFAEMNMFENGISNFKRGLDLAVKIQDTALMCFIYGNLTTCYYRYGDMSRIYFDSARKYNNKTIELATQLGSDEELHLAYQCKGLIETDVGNFDDAEKAFRKAIGLYALRNDVPLLSYSYYQLARMFIRKGNSSEADTAIRYLKLAREGAVADGDNSLLNEIFYEFAQVYLTKEDFENSALYALRFAEFNDSLIKLDNARTTAELSEKYESAKKENRINELNLLQKEKQAQIDRQLYMIIGSVIVLVFVGIAAFSLYRSNKIRKKANRELSEKNSLIEAQKAEVEKQKELIETKNKEITDSMNYARRIQQSLLPSNKYLERNLSKLKKENKG
jgi:tetratricopeptide (TPR) repeat protein